MSQLSSAPETASQAREVPTLPLTSQRDAVISSTPAPAADLLTFARLPAPGAMLWLAAIALLAGFDERIDASSSAVSVSLTSSPSASRDGFADDCFNVYLDFGSNVGIQVRKLFEPELYQHSPVLHIFDSYFGPSAERRNTTCAFGFEINPQLTSRLLMLQAAYSERGWRTRFYTEPGIGLNDTTLTFLSDNDAEHLFWGGKLIAGSGGGGEVQIPVISLANFIRAVLLRQVPPADGSFSEPRIVMKLDCEGRELEMLQRLADEGLLCNISFIYLEFHVPSDLTSLRSSLAESLCETEIVVLDDESYGTSNEPLPGRRRRLHQR